jgi:GxxExxY protein
MSKPTNWSMIMNAKKKTDEEFREFLGESLDHFTLSKEGIEEYNTLLEVANNVNKEILYGSREIVYRQEMAKQLKVREYHVREEQTFYQEVNGTQHRPRADLLIKNKNGECTVEIKLARRKSDLLQAAEYIVASNLNVGYLICFQKRSVDLYVLLRVDESLYTYTKGSLYLLPVELVV